MKKYIFLLVLPLLFSCSIAEKSTEEIVDEIDTVVILTEKISDTPCCDINFKKKNDQILYFYCERVMGDSGEQLKCYFEDGKLIYSEYCMIWDYPRTENDADANSYTYWETSVENYQLYFNNQIFVKCIKNGVEISNLNFEKPDYDPYPSDLIAFAYRVVNVLNTTNPDILCDWFYK